MTTDDSHNAPPTSTPPAPPRRWRRLRWLLPLVLLLLVLTLVLLPEGLRLLARQQLEARGARDVALADIDCNLFQGRLVIKGLRFIGPQGDALELERAEVDLAWRALFRRQLRFDRLGLRGLRLAVQQRQGAVAVAGWPLPAAPAETSAEPSRWSLGWDAVALNDLQLELTLDETPLPLHLRRLQLGGAASDVPEQPAAVDLELEAADGQWHLSGQLRPFLAGGPGFDGVLTVAEADLATVAPWVAEQVTGLAGRLGGRQTLAVAPADGRLTFSSRGQWELQQLQLQQTTQKLRLQQLRWDGEVALAAAPRVQGQLTAQGLEITAEGTRVAQQGLEGALQVQSEPAGLSVRLDDWSGRQLTVSAPDTRQWLQLESWQLTALNRGASGSLTLGPLTAEKGRVLVPAEGQGQVARFARLSLQKLSREGEGPARVDRITISGVEAHLRRTAEGTIPLLAAPQAAPAEAAAPSASAAAGVPLWVGQLRLEGQLRWEDASVQPPVALELNQLQLEAGPFDGPNPGQPLPFQLHSTVGRSGQLEVEGDLVPQAADPTGQFRLQLQGVELPPFTGYVESSSGYRVQTGKFTSRSQVALKEGVIDADNRLILQKVKLVVAPKEEGVTAPGANASLETLLGLLRDRKDDIELQIPVSGNLKDPAFDLSDAIAQATMGAAQLALTTYLKVLLSASLPPGTLFAAEKLVELAQAIHFNPVVFAPGTAQLPPEGTAYLAEVARLLRERPAVRLVVCGRVTAADVSALQAAAKGAPPPTAKPANGKDSPAVPPLTAARQEQLQILAQQRMEAVLQALEAGGDVDPERLFTCPLDGKLAAEGEPRVEISL